jgi:hypothetical protein
MPHLKADRRPQVVGFYNQQFLTAAGIASSGLSDVLSAAASAAAPAKRAAPAAVSVGTLSGETIALVNPQKNYAQFLLRALLPMIIHVVITLAAGYSVGSEFRRRDGRAWLESAGGDPVVALVGKLAPLFGIFFLMMLAESFFLEGAMQISFKGDVPLMLAAGSLLETLRDYDRDFGQVRFSALLCDEAQKIKTPGVRITDAAKAMNAEFRLATNVLRDPRPRWWASSGRPKSGWKGRRLGGLSKTACPFTGTLAAPRMVVVLLQCRQSHGAINAPAQMPACASCAVRSSAS